MTEAKQTVKVKGLSPIQTYPANTLSLKYGLDVEVIRKMKLGGQVEISPVIAMAMKADRLVSIVETKKAKEINHG